MKSNERTMTDKVLRTIGRINLMAALMVAASTVYALRALLDGIRLMGKKLYEFGGHFKETWKDAKQLVMETIPK